MKTTASPILKNKNNHIQAALSFAKKYLSTITRQNGENCFEHGLHIASIIWEISTEETLIIVAILHDIFLHPNAEAILKESPLSKEQQKLAQQMHSLRGLDINSHAKDLDQFIQAFTQDNRLVLLRMAHRLNDIRNIETFDPLIQKKLCRETLHMYASIAGRLGLHAWRYEMEDACFKVLHPEKASLLEKRFNDLHSLDLACLKPTKKFIATALTKNNIPATIEYRIKNLYSAYRKMLFKHYTFEELTDRLAIRVIVNNLEDCYRALGVIHSKMHPIPGKLKDYIGAPKENGYQSIHTVVFPLPGVTEQPIEIQIRTQQMHRECEYGTIAHDTYKDLSYSFRSGSSRVDLFSNLESLHIETNSPEQFETVLRTYFRQDHIGIFDHKNNMYHLKQPATAMDFICGVYKQKCLKLKTVRINGKISSVNQPLKNGDVVEALFTNHYVADNDWISACSQRSSKRLLRDLLQSKQERYTHLNDSFKK